MYIKANNQFKSGAIKMASIKYTWSQSFDFNLNNYNASVVVG
jgi:hypothetical protein